MVDLSEMVERIRRKVAEALQPLTEPRVQPAYVPVRTNRPRPTRRRR